MKPMSCAAGDHMSRCHDEAAEPRRKNSGTLAPSNGGSGMRLKAMSSSPIKPKQSPKHFTLQPYQQGDFDGLCGLYAIINAIRLVVRPSHKAGEDFCCDLFYALLRYASRHIALKTLINHGTPQWLMRVLLKWACAYVERRTALKPEVTQPFLGQGQSPFDTVMAATRTMLAQRHSAFIVELGGVHSHWTVIQAMSKAQVHLFDSSGLKLINMSDLRMNYDKTWPRTRHVVVARSVFMLSRHPAKTAGKALQVESTATEHPFQRTV